MGPRLPSYKALTKPSKGGRKRKTKLYRNRYRERSYKNQLLTIPPHNLYAFVPEWLRGHVQVVLDLYPRRFESCRMHHFFFRFRFFHFSALRECHFSSLPLHYPSPYSVIPTAFPFKDMPLVDENSSARLVVKKHNDAASQVDANTRQAGCLCGTYFF